MHVLSSFFPSLDTVIVPVPLQIEQVTFFLCLPLWSLAIFSIIGQEGAVANRTKGSDHQLIAGPASPAGLAEEALEDVQGRG